MRRREFKTVVGAAIPVGEHTADRMVTLHANPHRFRIPEFVANVEANALTYDQSPIIVEAHNVPSPALHCPRRVGQARHTNTHRRRQAQPKPKFDPKTG